MVSAHNARLTTSICFHLTPFSPHRPILLKFFKQVLSSTTDAEGRSGEEERKSKAEEKRGGRAEERRKAEEARPLN